MLQSLPSVFSPSQRSAQLTQTLHTPPTTTSLCSRTYSGTDRLAVS